MKFVFYINICIVFCILTPCNSFCQIFSNQLDFKSKNIASQKIEKLKIAHIQDDTIYFTLKVENFDEVLKNLSKYISQDKIHFVQKDQKIIIAELTQSIFDKISDNVLYFDFRKSPPHEESFLSDYFPAINGIFSAKNTFAEYFESAPLISLKENDVFQNDIDLLNRTYTSIYSSGKSTAHATDMGTILAGKGNTYFSSEGILPAAEISTTSFLNLFPDNIDYFKDNSITIQNHSYGLEVEDYYGIEAQAYDQQVFENPEMVHVFSSGNSGTQNAIFSQYAELEGFSNLTGTFKHAKNVITVGGIDSFEVHSPGSSIGPAYDGRIKPELVAYGYNGTSEAAAICSGSVAVIQNALEIEGYENRAETVKAILVAGAKDIGQVGPDFQTGFGSIDLYNSLLILKNKAIIQSEIKSNDILEFNFNATTYSNYNIVLSWLDPPAEINNNKALINDLDIEIEDEQGNIYFPYVLKHLPSQLNNFKEASTGRDSLNNLEQVVLDIEGKITIRVISKDLLNGSQKFSIAFSNNCYDCGYFKFPYNGAHIQSDSKFQVLWSPHPSNKIREMNFTYFPFLEQILSYVPKNNEKLFLDFPDTSAIVSANLEVMGKTVDEILFSVSPIPKISAAWQCSDSVLVTWEKRPFQKTFELFELVGDEMVFKESTNMNYFLVSNNSLSPKIISVREKIQDNFFGPRSLVLDLSKIVENCFYDRFYLEEIEGGIKLNLSLSSDALIDHIVFQKFIIDEFDDLEIFSNTKNLLSFNEYNLDEGGNRYRAIIYLSDGRKYFTEEINYVNVLKDSYFIFPTVVHSGEEINLLQSVYERLDFHLIDSFGNQIINETLYSESEYFQMDNFPNGVYFYFIKKGREIVHSGKIIIIP